MFDVPLWMPDEPLCAYWANLDMPIFDPIFVVFEFLNPTMSESTGSNSDLHALWKRSGR